MKRISAFILAILLLTLGLAGLVWSGPALAAGGEDSRGLSVWSGGSATIWTDRSTYRIGDDVRIQFKSSQTGYAVVYDYSADGSSQVVWPKDGSPGLILAGRTYSLPQGNDKIAASEPLGTDTLVLVVSPARATFTGYFSLGWYVDGAESRGLAVGGGGHGLPDGSFSAQCSFDVLPETHSSGASVQVQTSGLGSALLFGGLLLLLAGAAVLIP